MPGGPGYHVDTKGIDLGDNPPGVDMQFVAIGPILADMLYQTLQIGSDVKKNIVLFGESAAWFAAQQQHK